LPWAGKISQASNLIQQCPQTKQDTGREDPPSTVPQGGADSGWTEAAIGPSAGLLANKRQTGKPCGYHVRGREEDTMTDKGLRLL